MKKSDTDENKSKPFKQYNSLLNDYKNLILDTDRFKALDKSQNSDEGDKNLSKSIEQYVKMKSDKTYSFSYQEI